MSKLVRQSCLVAALACLSSTARAPLLAAQVAPTRATCVPAAIDTMRATVFLTARALPHEIPAERRQLLLQELAALLPPARELPFAPTFDPLKTHLDSATARKRLAPYAGLRFTLGADGHLSDALVLRPWRSWTDSRLELVLLSALAAADSMRVLGGVLMNLEAASVTIDLRLTTAPAPDETALPFARIAAPFARAEVPARFQPASRMPTVPEVLRTMRLRDTLTFLVSVTEDGRAMPGAPLLRGTWRELVQVTDSALGTAAFEPARAGGCAVLSALEATYVFSGEDAGVLTNVDALASEVWQRPLTISPSKTDVTVQPEFDACLAVRDSVAAVPPFRSYVEVVAPRVRLSTAQQDSLLGLLTRLMADVGVRPNPGRRTSRGRPSRDHRALTVTIGADGGTTLHAPFDMPDEKEPLLSPALLQGLRELVRELSVDSLRATLHYTRQPPADRPTRPVSYAMIGPTRPLFEFEVDEPALGIGIGKTPRYPNFLMEQGREGDVLVQFVVSTSGTVDMQSVKVLRSSHPAFSSAVLDVLPTHRFKPAKFGGCAVRMYVKMPFSFKMRSGPPRSTPSDVPGSIPRWR
jgi:TonB family protein